MFKRYFEVRLKVRMPPFYKQRHVCCRFKVVFACNRFAVDTNDSEVK